LRVPQSQQAFQHKPFKLEEVTLVYERYLCGRWQIYRFAAGAVVLAVLNTLAFSPLAGRLATYLRLSSSDLILSETVFSFVLLMEAWIWWVRISISTSIELLDYLEEHYGDPIGWATQES
jgi:hypothetical protein